MSATFGGIFKARSVFITGHTGFKGSWISLWLGELGARVSGYSLDPPTEPSNFAASRVADVLAADTRGDIRDGEKLRRALSAAAPDVIIHMAAQPLVRASYAEPRETFDVNVMGTAAVLDAVRALRRPCVVLVVTSDKCYENREQVWGYRENDAMGGYDPYSASKGAAEILTASYRRSFFPFERLAEHGVKLATVRAGNVIGGGDWAPDRIVVDTVRAISSGEPVPVRNPLSIRPWQHVLEPLSGYLALAARMLASDDPSLCGGWNFGPFPGREATVRELVETLCRAWGQGAWIDRSQPNQPHEAHFLRLCIDKAISELKWRPRWSTDMTIERTALWYKAYYQNPAQSMRKNCLDDIAAYEAAF